MQGQNVETGWDILQKILLWSENYIFKFKFSSFNFLSISNLNVDIISIHVSYRMGIFGFATDTETIEPNLGFLDQEMALNWIWDNIENLGGRKDKIVLAGQGFGGVSVLHHFEKFQPARKDSKF